MRGYLVAVTRGAASCGTRAGRRGSASRIRPGCGPRRGQRRDWRKIWSANPPERLNKEVKRPTDVVGTYPDHQSLLRVASCVLIEAHDEWQVADRRYLSEASMALLNPPQPTALEPRGPAPTEEVDRAALQTA